MPDTYALLFSLIAVANIAWVLRVSTFMAYLEYKHQPTYLDLARPGPLARVPWITLRVLAFIHQRRLIELNDIHLLRWARRMRMHLYIALVLDIAFVALGHSFFDRFSPTTTHAHSQPPTPASTPTAPSR